MSRFEDSCKAVPGLGTGNKNGSEAARSEPLFISTALFDLLPALPTLLLISSWRYAGSVSSSGKESVDGNAHKKPNQTRPPTGTSRNNCNHALLPLSRSLREPAASRGNKTASRNRFPIVSLKSVNAEAPSRTNNANHQNSGRDARPLNSAYFVRHTRIDSKNVAVLVWLSVFESEEIFIFNSLPILKTASLKDVTQFHGSSPSLFSARFLLPATVETPRFSDSTEVVSFFSLKTNSILEFT